MNMASLKSTEKFEKVITRVGNSTFLLLPNSANYLGFSLGTEVIVEIDSNKITITPRDPKLFESYVKGLTNKKGKLEAIFFDKDEIKQSPRFEHKTHFRNVQFTVILSFDHFEKKYLLIYFNKTKNNWYVNYITEAIYQEIKDGKNPENFIIMS
ncbi:MAG: hypothetical protein HeimC3_43580 [Candidatus Heimdallarchaeota archaeon LC_3]|nr:MAG: hypothetical protein HeimC3_49350 [Candidatus Heimdallarchaeota archaeon LC_3]OLS19829.1 MAG: hypothetical protein HeimC3_43580 [Candidatus Heimdallarchaeota archaeon LC_3]